MRAANGIGPNLRMKAFHGSRPKDSKPQIALARSIWTDTEDVFEQRLDSVPIGMIGLQQTLSVFLF